MIRGLTVFFAEVIWSGIRKGVRWSPELIRNWLIYFAWLSLVVYGRRWNLAVMLQFASSLAGIEGFGNWIALHIPKWMLLLLFSMGPFAAWLFFCGFRGWLDLAKARTAIRHLGLKTPTGVEPKVARIVELEGRQRRILVHAVGIDIESFRSKKGVLESGFNAIVQEIRVCPSNRQMVEILVSEKELPRLVRFDENANRLTEPYTFLVGETMDGFVTADLCNIHHLLVAGATGGGKSVFFKQVLVGLLKSSKFIQLYLLDLKRGVEFRPFGSLDNVEIAKDEVSSLSTLQSVVAEMERRFKLLEEKGFNEIHPERDNLDRIVVAIDEASVLFTVGKTSKANKENAQSAREMTDQIAKLGRAAGIHLILATQKVVKETIDTRVQTNINAKMCFRVNTIASSMTVIGNKKAADLPDVKGRGIWSLGSNDVVVQVPRLDADEITEEIAQLTDKFNGDASPLKQEMLQVMTAKKKKSPKLALAKDEIGEAIAAEGDDGN